MEEEEDGSEEEVEGNEGGIYNGAEEDLLQLFCFSCFFFLLFVFVVEPLVLTTLLTLLFKRCPNTNVSAI